MNDIYDSLLIIQAGDTNLNFKHLKSKNTAVLINSFENFFKQVNVYFLFRINIGYKYVRKHCVTIYAGMMYWKIIYVI